MGWRRSLWVAVVVALAVVVSGPVAVRGQDEPTTQPVLVTFLTGDQPDGGSFNAVLTGPIDIAAAYDALAGDGDAGIPVGTILPGDFGINAPHAWHLAGVSFADLTAEGCSGTASYVDQTLNTWLRLGTFCPWSATVVAVAPYSGPIPSVDGGPGPGPSPGPCPGDSLPEVAGPSVVTFATDGGPFQVLLTDPGQVALASEALATGCDPGVPAGAIVEGDGGVNVPHGWHLEGVAFVATADPACDATPDALDADLGTWVDQIGRFCPSSASVIDVQPYGEGGGPSPAPSPAPTLCDVVPDGSGPALATFDTGPEAGDTFRAVLTDPLSVALAREELVTGTDCGFPIGLLEHGDGGVNAPHAWHLQGAEMVEGAIELCDGTASMVDADLDYWVNTVGSFCPWGATVIDIQPLGASGTDPTPTPSPDQTPTPGPGDGGGPGDGEAPPGNGGGSGDQGNDGDHDPVATAVTLPSTGAGPAGAPRSTGLPWVLLAIGTSLALGSGLRTGTWRRL